MSERKSKGGARKLPPPPVCEIHGCSRLGVFKCVLCRTHICGKHTVHETLDLCVNCNYKRQQEEDEGCPLCGQDECTCHEDFLGHPENCPMD